VSKSAPRASLLPIGRFARACRLSIKALRHYDELGLLRPARVDGSGFRYYASSQARDAVAISLLRSFDVPLTSIKEILAARDPKAVSTTLEGERARIQRDLARARQALSCVERIMREGALLPYEITVRDEPAYTLLAVTSTTRPELHVEEGYAALGRLEAVFGELGAPLRGPVMCLLPEPPEPDTLVLQLCAPAPRGVAPDAARAAGATLIELAGGPMAYAVHHGAYEEVGLAQHAVLAWMHERGHAIDGPVREIYVDDPAVTPRDEVRTEVGVRLAD
jgi:DNA-binding transcriptional MerR regulator